MIDSVFGNIANEDQLLAKDSPHYPYYQIAQEFTREVGLSFAQRVFQNPSSAILMCYMGSEHLAVLLQSYQNRMKQAGSILPVFLNRSMFSDLTNLVSTCDDRVFDNASFKAENADKCVAPNEKKGAFRELGQVSKYLASLGLFDSESLLIVDTGSKGTFIKVISAALRAGGYQGQAQGLLLYYEPSLWANPWIKINGFNAQNVAELERLKIWTCLLDQGGLDGTALADHLFKYPYKCFPKSRMSPGYLTISAKDYEPNTPLKTDPDTIADYQATCLGFRDAIDSLCSLQ